MLRAGAEGALAATAAGAVAGAIFPQRRLIFVGLALAWAACTIGTAGLAFGKKHGPAWFWRAFGLGAALRGAVLVALVAVAWRWEIGRTAALLLGYVAGLTGIILLEFRHLVKDLGGGAPVGLRRPPKS